MAFELHYQPQINIRTRRVSAFEALLRWNHPVRGPVSPADFIGVAEDLGLIKAIGTWVLKEACQAATSWPSGIRVAVNVSPAQIAGGDLPGIIAAALKSSGLHPSRLEIEITESLLIGGDNATLQSLQAIRATGVRIALDDFGSGFSSLSYLPQFRFDKIKIDRSFVDGLGQTRDRSSVLLAIIRAVTGICADLDMTCTAEGVETDEQLAVLSSENCTDVQGHLFCEALPAGDIPAYLARTEAAGLDDTARGVRTPGISFFQIAQTANDVIMVTTADLGEPGPTIIYVNPAFTKLTGFSAAEAMGMSPRLLQGAGTSRATLDAISAKLRAGDDVREKILNYDKSGAPYWLDMRIMPLRDTEGTITHFAAIERDITLEKRGIDAFEGAADRHALTGMPNRRAFLRIMESDIAMVRTKQGCLPTSRRPCLAHIEIDNLKSLNAAEGRAVGDALLLGLADRLAEITRRSDLLGHVGGAAFGAWMPSVTLQEGRAIAKRFRTAAIAVPFDTPLGPYSVAISVGVAAWKDGESVEALMSRAKAARQASLVSRPTAPSNALQSG